MCLVGVVSIKLAVFFMIHWTSLRTQIDGTLILTSPLTDHTPFSDKNRVLFGNPDHNPRTLLVICVLLWLPVHVFIQVPLSFLNKLTPAMRQWWTIKSDNYDTILFFKVLYMYMYIY